MEGAVRRGDGREAFLSGAQLAKDADLDMRRERRVRAGDEVGQHGDERRVLGGEPDGLGAGGVDQADAVIGVTPISA